MRKYELMVVVRAEFPHTDENKRMEFVKKALSEQPIHNLAVSDFGKRQLAYEIKKQTEGCYLLATFEAETVNMARLEQQVKLTPDILRYLLTRLD